jgi:hypothetical protein
MIDLDNLFKSEEKIEPTVVGGAMGMEPIPVEEHISINTEHILEEWSYRCESGYPTYGKRDDMIHLQNILDERSISLPFERIMTINEDVASKEELIQLIQTTELPDKVLQYIARQVDSLSAEGSVIEVLKTKGYDDQHAKRIFDKSVELNSYNDLRTYLSNPKKMISFAALGESGNLIAKFARANLNKEFLDWLYLYKPTYGGVASGNAENMLRVLLKGGHIPNKGDVGTDKFDVEAKTSSVGSGFRLTGQSGYGNGAEVSKYVLDSLARYYGKSLDAEFFDITDGKQMQLYYDSNKESLADTIVKDLIKKKKLTKKDAAKIYANAFKLAYRNYKGNLEPIILSCMDSSGKIDTKKFFPLLAAVEFRYYADGEDWGALIALNDKGDYIVLNRDASIDQLAQIFATRFKLTAPNTKAKSTVQDSRVGLEFKG